MGSCVRGDWSSLVIVVSGELCGVVGPVTAGVAHPADRGGGCQVQQVGEDGGGELGGELQECGATAGLGVDAEFAEPGAESAGGERSTGQQSGEQPARTGW
jgi:hypothetical protein